MFFQCATACDICGCGVGNSYIGILPDFSKQIIGIRYRFNSLISHLGKDGASTYLTTDEMYKTIELWGGWNISDNVRLMASIPYSLNEQINQGLSRSKDGIGDASVSAFYQLINSRKTFGTNLFIQSLWLGGGIKLPTGKYNPKDKSVIAENANLFQLGTGSTDFSLNAMYDLRVQDIGINLTANYKMNTTNQYAYRYGNKFSTNVQLYYKIRLKKIITIAPNAGLLFETAAKDTDHNLTVDISGGNLSLATLGLETGFRNISIGGNWQTPLAQNLAEGIIKANNRFMVHLAFVL